MLLHLGKNTAPFFRRNRCPGGRIMKRPPCLHIGSPYNGGECPEMEWDGRTGTGCPAWVEYKQEQPAGSGNFVVLKKGCSYLLQTYWLFEITKLLESIYSINEDHRNGVCTVGKDGKVYPKSSQETIEVISAIKQAAGLAPLLSEQKMNVIGND